MSDVSSTLYKKLPIVKQRLSSRTYNDITMKLTGIYKHLFQRRLPFGLFSWRFLLPKQTPSIKFHRQLMMKQLPHLPRSIFLPIALFNGLKWILIYSPYYSLRTVKYRYKNIQDKTGLSFWRQYRRVLMISMGHGLSPKSWYQYQMYLPENKEKLWANIYDQEAGAFHQHRNQNRKNYKKHAALLGDKWLFEQTLLKHSITSAATLALIPKGISDFSSQLQALIAEHGRIFCKRRTGNRGQGAFSVFVKDSRLQIQPKDEKPLSEVDGVNFLQKNIQKYDYLIQPDYKHHQRFAIARSGLDRPATTVRIISRIEDKAIYLEHAVLYWQLIEEETVRFHYPIAINTDSGTLDNHLEPWPRNNFKDEQLEELKHFIAMLSDKPLPFWSQALKLIRSTHPLLAGIDQIAWDFILSEERAVLLEGNSGWGGLAVCQWFEHNLMQYSHE